MRKSRFLLSLIAATAIGLSVVGCESSDSGSIADTTDLTVSGNDNQANERRNLREYMLVAQRGLNDGLSPDFAMGQGAPAGVVNPVVAAPGDDVTDQAFLFELLGISSTPNPNAIPVPPGQSVSGPGNTPGDVAAAGSTGYHQVYPSPGGNFVIGMARAKNRGFTGDEVETANVEIMALQIEAPLDEVFPPNIIFGNVADPVPIRLYPPNQGEFVSGAWSSNAQQFYAAINGRIDVYTIDGTIGRITPTSSVAFPVGVPGTINNAAQLIASADGTVIWALDNANSQILIFSRSATDGSLTLVTSTPTVGDPHGFALDRTGRFLYVAGRSSEQLAGYRVAGTALTAIDLFPQLGIGPIPFNFGAALGDVATSPVGDSLFLASYAGVLQAYSTNATTGALAPVGNGAAPLAFDRNLANIEVEPTGRFVVGSFEHDFETFDAFSGEGQVFANINTATNGLPQPPGTAFSATPQLDNLLQTIVVLPSDDPFTGSVQVYRIEPSGAPRAEERLDSIVNPYGLSFFQRVLQPPSGEGPIVP
jgi:hypothetical protein